MSKRPVTTDRAAFDTRATVRCAIYTRKSSEEGLEQEFNSLDAQRDSAENFIASQKHAGWVCVQERYDDGGFTGGNIERPAVQRLLADIQAGKIDCVVVYKVDRLSRSLLDFSRMMETYERHNVSFVSVTQQFNTTHSMGRLTLSILLSFAQCEREITSERTRDKIAAARKKGRWGGGALLRGLVKCQACGCAMGHHFATDGPKRYRYYVCQRAQKRGWKECPGPSLPAFELEKFVIDQLRALGRDDGLVSESVVRAQGRLRGQAAAMEESRGAASERLQKCRSELRSLTEAGKDKNGSAARASGLREEIRELDAEVRKLDGRIKIINSRVLDEDELAGAIESFDPLWEHLTTEERERLVQLLVRQVEYDAVTESISVTFHDGNFTDPEEIDA